jgi:LysM repeat protein
VSRFGMAMTTTAVAFAAMSSAAGAALPHTVAPGETLWSIAAQNNLTTRTVAAYNGLSEDAQVYVGETIQIPTEAEGAAAIASSGAASSPTSSATSGTTHVVQPGETLTSVAAANGISTASLAAANGLAPDALLISGQEITIPTSSAGASTGSVTAGSPAPSPSSTALSSPPPEEHPSWTSPIYCPSCPNGEAYLASNAAYNWNAMRQASLDTYGIDLYPAGPLSAYRSYGQQLYLYDLYLAGQGNLAASPGTSSHEYGAAVDLADPAMANVIHEIGAAYGWAKTEAPGEWWHVSYVGP